MELVRQAIIKHMENLRAFVLETLRIDSGIYDVDQLNTILVKPETIVEMETDWIRTLLEALNIIQRYNNSVDSWVNHAHGLAKNLGASVDEIAQIERRELGAVDLFQSKSFETDYLRWVLADVSQELDRLILTSQQLMFDIPRLLELADQFGGFYFEQVKQIAKTWMSDSYSEFYTPLISMIKRAHSLTENKEKIENLGKYVEILAGLGTSVPIFVVESSTTETYSPTSLKSSQRYVKKLLEGTENLRKFVQLRTQAYLLLLRHYEALLRAILPHTISIQEWISAFRVDPNKAIDDLLPSNLPTDTLPLAVQLAKDALTDWDTIIEKAKPYFTQALILNDLLQSPAVAKFLGADQRRLELYHEWRPRIDTTFSKLQTAKGS